jgi:hypothetical protein
MPSFKARPLQLAVKEAGIDPKSAKDEEILYIFKLAIWLMHKSLLTHIPRTLPEEIIKLDAKAIWEIKKHINDLAKRKSLRDELTVDRMKRINESLNEATAIAGAIVEIYSKHDQSGDRILFIYQLCDQLKAIFDYLEGEALIDPTTSINCSFDAIIRINYKQKALIRQKKDQLQTRTNDTIKFCFCIESILKWCNQLKNNVPFSFNENDLITFEEAITNLKTIIEFISYSSSIGNKIHIHEINELLNTAASQIGEAIVIHKIEKASIVDIKQRYGLLISFTDQLNKLHEQLKKEKISCP